MVNQNDFETLNSTISDSRSRRPSRASIKFFQTETSTRKSSFASTATEISARNLVRGLALDGCDHGLIGSDGKIRDEYILQRQSINHPANLTKIPFLCDLAAASSITEIDGWVFTMLLVSGFAKLSSKINELNTINVFPIADGDTGANMKVCLKLPTRNLLLNPSDNILIAASNMAADVLLNGQGNSGTILSHFFVCLAEEIRERQKASLTIDEFASCLQGAGIKMDDAVPNPVEGTLLSVCRDACKLLGGRGPYKSLESFLADWNELAMEELALTPDRLIVDGVKVLQKAGVVDSGAQGFVYLIEGMYLASKGMLPNAMDANIFATSNFLESDEATASIDIDHTVCDSKFRFCTECVIDLKHDVDAQSVLNEVNKAVEEGFGDSIATVKGPSKDGGEMMKIHIHTNTPDKFFNRLQPYNKGSKFKKEKVEDMFAMREMTHGEKFVNLADANFTIMGFCSYLLPPLNDMEDLFTIPVFLVPETTQEPLDMRYIDATDICVALNQQRHEDTAIKYTTAASNPMQIKIEILAALRKGKPLLLVLWSLDRRISAIGRNAMQAVDMLEPEQKAMVKVFVHSWGFHEAPFLLEAIKCAHEGKTIDNAIASCKRIADYNFAFSNFMASTNVNKLLAWRPGLFPEGFTVKDDSFIGFGIPITIRNEAPDELKRAGMLYNVQLQKKSMNELHDAEIARIKMDLKGDECLSMILCQTTGRPDYGYDFIEKMKNADVPISKEAVISVYSAGPISIIASNWGEMSVLYTIEKLPEPKSV